ncbi:MULTISPECIES: hypothetical protein [Psychrobacter]|uniref:hypothetical protein n=1 Tax=Psychrobacter TaxID=497 RepID=UPI00146C0603|nr:MULTISPECIES: hypothetical protein [Psychrobacter]
MKFFKPLPLIAPLPDGTKIHLPKEWFENNDERGIIARLLIDKRYFGSCYRKLNPLFFENNFYKGVVVSMLVDSYKVHPELKRPGDVDVLIIPYTKDSLVFSETMAIEAKVLRSAYTNQNKSPNQFGFSQAEGLWNIGFPYVAVAHFIVSDLSPTHQWRKILQGTVGKNDTINNLKEVYFDDLPLILMARTLGRLSKSSKNQNFGLLSSYLGNIKDKSMFFPDGTRCIKNPLNNEDLIKGLIKYYSENYKCFLNIPKNPPN